MISQALIRHIRSLERKKFRKQHGFFIAEGDKIVRETLQGDFPLDKVLALEGWMDANADLVKSGKAEFITVTEKDLARVSLLKTPNQALALARIPQYQQDAADLDTNLTLALDNLQDPGNLGTIIRTADWFGIRNIYCSHGSADIYNPKAIQASMGSFIRVKVHYVELPEWLSTLDDSIPVYGAFLQGQDIHNCQTSIPGVLVIGNESQGISPGVALRVKHPLRIPGGSIEGESTSAESLNAAIAAGILMAWLKRL